MRRRHRIFVRRLKKEKSASAPFGMCKRSLQIEFIRSKLLFKGLPGSRIVSIDVVCFQNSRQSFLGREKLPFRASGVLHAEIDFGKIDRNTAVVNNFHAYRQKAR